jgi:hypothetical protein
MKRLIVITIILLVAAGYITATYFKNLNPPGQYTSQVIRSIPGNASLIFEFSNDNGFYDIFGSNKLFTAFAGQDNLDELSALRKNLAQKPSLNVFFTGQNIFISIHPLSDNKTDLLLTIAAKQGFDAASFGRAAKNSNMIISPYKAAGDKGYTIYFKNLQKRFFLVDKGHNIFSGSFSKELADQSAAYKPKDEQPFTLLPAQQNTNALANLYINNTQLPALFGSFFKNDNDLLRGVRLLPATAVLSLNYKSDALMFNGATTINKALPESYFGLFANQQPVENHLKDIFPSTTAYFTNFAVSDVKGFTTALSRWQKKAKIHSDETSLMNTIDNETGVNIRQTLHSQLGNEFAVVTTRFQEKLGIISLKNGSKILPSVMSVSAGMSENSGRFNYDKLPYFLLGDAFSIFKRPYFIIIDNYLILANSYQEIESYNDSYLNRKFLIKMRQYNNFDYLMSQRSNVCFFIGFKNTDAMLKRDMHKNTYRTFDNNEAGWGNIYGISYQLTASDKNYYTNFCIALNEDTESKSIDSVNKNN